MPPSCADLRVLNEYPQIHSISAFNNIYNNTGIFGIQVTTVSIFEAWISFVIGAFDKLGTITEIPKGLLLCDHFSVLEN